ncbi:hypothetical protein APY94_02375 [Thermococcus celericrescens]|uniref:Uncharacterized protein n=1 Tax=Thermococcus celericrescens TaxID=227598 RepID=A0A100XZA1_9EURY|nr:hypothetical protein [Thermococcus celericrescens]KUH34325.1 hypothetical protein APY94_02375 [Thermococcus celericrescens]
MKVNWKFGIDRGTLLYNLKGLLESGDIEYYRSSILQDRDYILIGREVPLFSADCGILRATEEMAAFNFSLLGISGSAEPIELRTGRVDDSPYLRALTGGNLEPFFDEHSVLDLGSYDPFIGLHLVPDGERIHVLSLEWYGPHQWVYDEVPVDEWLDSTVRFIAMAVRDMEAMRETLLRFGYSNYPRILGRAKALLRLLLDAHPVDIDALPPAYAPWEVEEISRLTSMLLARDSVDGALEVISTLRNPNHFLTAVFEIGSEVPFSVVEEFYRSLPMEYRGKAMAHLVYRITWGGLYDEGLKLAEEIGSDEAYHSAAIALINSGLHEAALRTAERIENRWRRGKVLLKIYFERPELAEEIKERAPEHVRVFIEEREKVEP